jgi:ribose transport system permease protein
MAMQDSINMSGAPETRTSPHAGEVPLSGRAASGSRPWQKRLQTQGPLVALIGLCLLFSLLAPNFGSLANVVAVLESAAVPAIIAIGLTFVLMQASIDLSVEGVASLANIIVSITLANTLSTTDVGLWIIPLVIVTGAAIGATSGIISVHARMPSLIVTLGMWLIALGFASLLFPNRQPQITAEWFTSLSIDKIYGVSALVYLAGLCALAALLVERHTVFGRMSRAIGENEGVLRMSGIRVNRYKIAAFTLAGVCFAIAGLFIAARVGVGNPRSGVGFLFPCIAACVVGGTLLSGGHGGILQSMIGVLILMVLRNGLIQIGVDPLLQSAVEGAVIIIAVAASTWHLRRKIRVIK